MNSLDFSPKSQFENSERSCGEGFWLRPRRRGRSVLAAGCKGQANAGRSQKNRRPRGFRANSRLASLLLGYSPLRGCALVGPRLTASSTKNSTPRSFQTGSNIWPSDITAELPENKLNILLSGRNAFSIIRLSCKPYASISYTLGHS
jgi:hypothetical protein